MAETIAFRIVGETGDRLISGAKACREALDLAKREDPEGFKAAVDEPCIGPISKPHVPIVAFLALCAFGEDGPRKYHRGRWEYIDHIHDLFEDAYRLVWDERYRIRVQIEGRGESVEFDLGGHRGYSGIIPLTKNGLAHYALGLKSQFELERDHVCEAGRVAAGKIPAIYVQALFDMRRLPFRNQPATLRVRGHASYSESDYVPTTEVNPDILVARSGRQIRGEGKLARLFDQDSPNERFRAKALARRLHGMFPRPDSGGPTPGDPYAWAEPPFVCFEATSRDGERFARHSFQFWRPTGLSRDGNRIFGFNFEELAHADRLNPECVDSVLEFCRNVLESEP